MDTLSEVFDAALNMTTVQAVHLRNLTEAIALFNSLDRRSEATAEHNARKAKLGITAVSQGTACEIMDALEMDRLLTVYNVRPDKFFKKEADALHGRVKKILSIARESGVLAASPPKDEVPPAAKEEAATPSVAKEVAKETQVKKADSEGKKGDSKEKKEEANQGNPKRGKKRRK